MPSRILRGRGSWWLVLIAVASVITVLCPAARAAGATAGTDPGGCASSRASSPPPPPSPAAPRPEPGIGTSCDWAPRLLGSGAIGGGHAAGVEHPVGRRLVSHGQRP